MLGLFWVVPENNTSINERKWTGLSFSLRRGEFPDREIKNADFLVRPSVPSRHVTYRDRPFIQHFPGPIISGNYLNSRWSVKLIAKYNLISCPFSTHHVGMGWNLWLGQAYWLLVWKQWEILILSKSSDSKGSQVLKFYDKCDAESDLIWGSAQEWNKKLFPVSIIEWCCLWPNK